MKKTVRNLIISVILLIASLLLVGSKYYMTNYPDETFDQILYYVMNGVSATSENVIKNIIYSNIVPLIIVFIVFDFIILLNLKNRLVFKITIRSKEIRKQIFPIKHKLLCSLVIFLIFFIVAVKAFGINEYLINISQDTELYEKYYVSGDSSYIIFPENKRNLIFISLESMETTLCSKENGGGWNYSLIPELEKLALENITFSNTEKLGGPYQVTDTHFTAAALVAQTAGIPLKTNSITINSISGRYNGNGRYLENAYTLGDILKEQGYNLEIMMGSDGNFGGRTQYFVTNGDYKIFDVNSAIRDGKMTEEERVWWGFEDDRLFEWAKEEILELASKDEPFNFIMQTADTHFVDGYLSENAEKKYDNQYENVFAYSSKLTYEFVEWLQKQDFYENTTIVILGDHLGKQAEFYENNVADDYQRTVYNVIINSALEAQNQNMKNRKFSSMDFYPTILASMGVEINGDRLGLGTNLFSKRLTLVEELGFDYLDGEAKKNSTFYNAVLLGKDYHKD